MAPSVLISPPSPSHLIPRCCPHLPGGDHQTLWHSPPPSLCMCCPCHTCPPANSHTSPSARLLLGTLLLTLIPDYQLAGSPTIHITAPWPRLRSELPAHLDPSLGCAPDSRSSTSGQGGSETQASSNSLHTSQEVAADHGNPSSSFPSELGKVRSPLAASDSLLAKWVQPLTQKYKRVPT